MALAEISANSLIRNGKLSDGSPKKSPARELPLAAGRNYSRIIRHNLPNSTTGTGDTGPLSIKQSRLPYPVARISPRKYRTSLEPSLVFTASHAASLTVDEGPYAAIKKPDGVFRDRNISTASSIISMYRRESQNHAGMGAQQKTGHDYRSYSMSQASLTSYTLSNHRSYASLKDSRVPSGPLRPRSPFLYPTRLRRPGFRPSSPAFSDLGGGDYRSTASLWTSSPASSYAKRRHHGNGQEHKKVSSSLLTTPTPSVHSRQHSKGTPTSSRMGTPVPTLTPSPGDSDTAAGSTDSQSHIPQNCQGDDLPSPPLYYDYTEEFENEGYSLSRPTNSFPFLTIDKTIPEDHPATTIPSSDSQVGKVSVKGSRPQKESRHQPKRSESPGYQNSETEDSGAYLQAVGKEKTNTALKDFSETLHGGLEPGSQPNSGLGFDGYRVRQNVGSFQNQRKRASSFSAIDHGQSQGNTPFAFRSPERGTMHEYSRPGFSDNTEIYTRLSARGRDNLSVYRRESGLGDYTKRKLFVEGKEELSWSTIPPEPEAVGTVLERPISSYSRRSSIRRFFSSDQGFKELPEILTSFEAIGRPYTPDQFLKREQVGQYGSIKSPSLKGPKTPNHRQWKAESDSLESFDQDLQFSRQDKEDEELIKRSASKLTKRSLQEKQAKTFTVVGDISAIDGVPQTHVVSRESSRHKRRVPLTVQEEFPNAVSGISRARLMQQLPLLPIIPSDSPALADLRGLSSMPVELPGPDISRSAANQGRHTGKGRNLDLPGDIVVNGLNLGDEQTALSRTGTPLTAPQSPESLFPTTGRIVAIGEPKCDITVTKKRDEADMGAVPQRPGTKTTMRYQNHAISGSFDAAAAEKGIPSSSSGEAMAFQPPNDVLQKVSFHETRHTPTYKIGSKGIGIPHAYDQGGHGKSVSQQRNLGGRAFIPEAEEVGLRTGYLTGRGKHARGRSNTVDLVPSPRHANPSEPRSVFSDDSSHITSSRNALKRLTNFRAKLPILTAGRRSRDSPGRLGHLERTIVISAPANSRMCSRRGSLGETAAMVDANYKVKRLALRLGSWLRQRRDRSRVVFKKFRRNRATGATDEKTDVCHEGV